MQMHEPERFMKIPPRFWQETDYHSEFLMMDEFFILHFTLDILVDG